MEFGVIGKPAGELCKLCKRRVEFVTFGSQVVRAIL